MIGAGSSTPFIMRQSSPNSPSAPLSESQYLAQQTSNRFTAQSGGVAAEKKC